jgi:hypothetical protein
MSLEEESENANPTRAPTDLLPELDLSQGEAVSDAELSAAREALVEKMKVGSWVELLANGVWSRTQLGWISPQHTMYLFTSVQGKTQSMTKHMLLRLIASDALRPLAERSVVDGALDAVVHTATLNSLDLRLV